MRRPVFPLQVNLGAPDADCSYENTSAEWEIQYLTKKKAWMVIEPLDEPLAYFVKELHKIVYFFY